MPSPFPGMDPYLEQPALWPGVHQRLITYLGDTLNAMLPSRYVADIGERLYVVQSEREIYPDVVVSEYPPVRVPAGQDDIGTTTAVASDIPWVLVVEPIEVREVFIEVLALAEGERVVTTIEILSPANKAPGSEGRKLYLTRQQEILQSQVHLIEIDLLRHGEYTVAPPRELLLRKGGWDYLVSLHRGGEGERYEVWTVAVQQRLPRIRVPLASGDPDVVVDLQVVIDRCCDEGGYARRIDYLREPSIPLSSDDARWARALLRERGLESNHE